MLIAAMAIDDQHLLATVARHLIRGLLQQLELQRQAVGHCTRLVLGLEDLSKVVLREYHNIFLVSRGQAQITDVDQVRTQRQVGSMLLQNAEGKQTGSLRALDGLNEVGRGKFLPPRREL